MEPCERTMAAATLWSWLGFISLLWATLNASPVALAPPNEASSSELDTSLAGASSQAQNEEQEDRLDQFQCQVDGRWLPLEWRCDFSEQCLDGQDEFGCVPERCNFDHDLCNWRAQGLHQHRPPSHRQPWWASGGPRTSGGTWLRYAGGVGPRRGETPRPSQGLVTNSHQSTASLQQQRLRELHERLGEGRGRLLFAPLARPSDGDDDGGDDNNNGAHLMAPFVGQTNSMCRLRFRYALVELADRRLAVSLALFARNASDRHQSVRGLAGPLWSAALEPGNLGRAAWTVGVAELGHLSRVELVFEARLVEVASGDQLAPGETSTALAALAELHFVDCAWPQAAPPPQNLEVFVPGAAGSGNEWPLVVEPQVECQEGQFQCASTKLCLESRKLCNFVNDCMGPDGGEDERHQLCSPVVGREDFEPAASEGLGGDLLDWTWLLYPAPANRSADGPQPWTLATNLARNIIRVRSSSEREPHLPRRDHTNGHHRHGHYLSVDISLKSLRNSAVGETDRQVSWLYLDSGWLRRTGEETLDCRVKFFYNLISSGLPASMSMPFKIYLALDHFVAIENGSRLVGSARKHDRLIRSHREPREPAPSDELLDNQLIELPGVDFWREANYQVPELAVDQPFYLRIVVIVRPNSGGQAELLDDFRASLSIDDLATHFGCGRLVEDTSELDKFRQIGQRNDNVTLHFNLNDYIQQQLEEPQVKSPWPAIRSRNRFADGSCAIQYEPHKLILCVLAVLVSLLGAIGVIVFVIVPYVERITISYHDQLAMGLSTIDSTPRNSTPNLLDACELLNDADWEQVSRRWRRQGGLGEPADCRRLDEDNNTMIESLSTALDSRNNSQTMSDSNSQPFDLV